MQSDLYQQVVSATDGEYEVLAELGHAPERGTAYLARALADGGAAVLVVPPAAESLDVVGALGEAVPATGGRCASCGSAFTAWADACARCGRSMTPPVVPDVEAGAVAAEAGHQVELLGAVPHARGGLLYFGRDRGDQRLVAYAAHPRSAGGVWLDPLWEADVPPPRPAGAHAFTTDAPATTGGAALDGASRAPRRRGWVIPMPAGFGRAAPPTS